MTKLGRRGFLTAGALGLGAAAIHMDPLVSLLRADTPGACPKRLMIFFSPLGAVRDSWLPTGGETSFTLGTSLAPLAPFQSDIIVCDGINQQREIYSSANHQEIGGILTGMRVEGDEASSRHAHISVDQFIANDDAVTGGTAFRSISLAAWQSRYYRFLPEVDHMYMSALGPGRAVIPEGLPQAAFDRIFGGFTAPDPGGEEPMAPPPMEDPRRARRRSVLDAVAGDLTSLQSGLSGREREKIDQHLTSIRALEQRLASTTFTGGGTSGGGAACTVPERPGEYEIDDDSTLDIRFRLQLDIAINALACDRSRVVAVTGEGGRSDARHPWLGITEKYHGITHEPHYTEHAAINRWYAEEFAYVLQRLSEIPEGTGSLLDNTCVAWVSEQGMRTASSKHSRENVPYIIAGACGGYFQTGRFKDFGGVQSNSFLITLMNAMGIAGNTFGEVTAEPLSGIAR